MSTSERQHISDVLKTKLKIDTVLTLKRKDIKYTSKRMIKMEKKTKEEICGCGERGCADSWHKLMLKIIYYASRKEEYGGRIHFF